MVPIFFALIGVACGALAMFAAVDSKRKNIHAREGKVLEKELESKQQVERFYAEKAQFTEALQREKQSLSQQLQERINKLTSYENTLNQREGKLAQDQQEYEKRVIAYSELQCENTWLKRDVRNLAIEMQKIELDQTLQQQSQEVLDKKATELGARYLQENVKWISKSLNANNFASCKQRLIDVIERCRGIGLEVSGNDEQSYISDLKVEYEKQVRIALEREEQARIKAQIREEQKLEREIQREQERIAREKAIVEAALATALASAADVHSTEIEMLRARLAEAESKERAISQAQLTKAGFVYVISNIGSFGDGVFKIGMTRRLEPQDRVRELGDASVPFPFDVHMMISCQNAPTLENALHRALVKHQVNRTNPKKEFFRTSIDTIVRIVKENHGEVEYVADAEALQYRQSESISDEDAEFIEQVFEHFDDDGEEVEDQTDPVKSPAEVGTASA